MAGMTLLMTWLAVMTLPSGQGQDLGSPPPHGLPPLRSVRRNTDPSWQEQESGLWSRPQVGIPNWSAASWATSSGLKELPSGQKQESGTELEPVQGLVSYSMENWKL